MNEKITTEGGRTTLRMERRLAHRPQKVWRALTDPAQISQWFPTEVRVQGQEVHFGFGPSGRLLELTEPRVFAFTWGDDELRWEIEPDGEGSVLVLTHVFGDHFGAASFAAGWHTCVRAMADVLDGRSPAAAGDMAPLHEDFVAILGLTSGTISGGAVRLERQLPRHADAVWRELGGEQARQGEQPPAGFVPQGVQAGPVSRVEAGKLLEFGGVRFELAQGTGQGARLIVTGPAPGTLQGWRSHVAGLCERLARG
ncbi:MAG: SRPBCC family protein [Nonomuraea sp.]|nr:SRPBCC family protein [Nonomuraea sp.]